jgi:hypothetical protein
MAAGPERISATTPKRSIDTVLGKGMIRAVLEPVLLQDKAVAVLGLPVVQAGWAGMGNERKGLFG